MKTISHFHRILAAARHPLVAFLDSAVSTRLKGRLWRNSRGLGLAAILCFLVNALTAGQFGNFTYTDDGASITITGYTSDEVGAALIPAIINDKPVTSIGYEAFGGCYNLTGITIPDSVTSIANWAFLECTRLTSITFGDGVTIIGNNAFCGCTGLISVVIGDGVTTIGDRAFYDCTGLTSVTFGNSVTTIGKEAFLDCSDLTGFMVKSHNPFFSSASGVMFTKRKTSLIQCPEGKAGRYTVPDNVTSIGDHAFSRCSRLTNITIPGRVARIGDGAFETCPGLKAITVKSRNSSFSSASGVLFNKRMTRLIRYPEGKSGKCYTVPKNVTRIADEAFADSRLTSIIIPKSVTHIGDYAFSGCGELINVAIPKPVTRIGNGTFAYCHRLTAITIPDHVTSIGDYAFYDCDGLRTLTIGRNVTSVGTQAFGTTDSTDEDICYALKRVVFLGNAPTVGSDIFSLRGGMTIYFPIESTGFTSPRWLGYSSIPILAAHEISVTGGDGVELTDGGTIVDFGTVYYGGYHDEFSMTYTITNVGRTQLKGLAITKNGPDAGAFWVYEHEPAATELAPFAQRRFTVAFNPVTNGLHRASIHISSNDSDENPFDIILTGMGVASQSYVGLPEFALSAPGISGKFNTRIRSVTSMLRIDGNKYRCITIIRNGATDPGQETVEVSSNLVDWFSGPKHTTVMEDSAELLKVRDNTPIEPGKKRFIRAR